MALERVALACLLLLALSASVSARALLKHGHGHGHGYGKHSGEHGHGHGKHHGEHGHRHGFHGGDKCHTISDVLHGTPSLARFSKALDKSKLPFLSNMFGSPWTRATFLAVQDEDLGSGDTVFSESAVRFLQHTIFDKVDLCHPFTGLNYTTLAGSGVHLVVEEPTVQPHGRKLSQMSTAWTSLMAALPLNDERPDAARIPDQFERHMPNDGEHKHKDAHGEHEDDGADKHKEHHKKHEKEHHKKKCKGKHGASNGKRTKAHGKGVHSKEAHAEHASDVAQKVAHALEKGARKEAKRGAVYIYNEATSQRVKVLGTVKACEGLVVIVSAFLNAPPTPDADSLALMAAGAAHKLTTAAFETPGFDATSFLEDLGHGQAQVHTHVHEHHHHHHHHHSALGHLFHGLKHAFHGVGKAIDHWFRPGHHAGHRHCRHAQAIRAARAQTSQPIVTGASRDFFFEADGDAQVLSAREKRAVQAFLDADAALRGGVAAPWEDDARQTAAAAGPAGWPQFWRLAATSQADERVEVVPWAVVAAQHDADAAGRPEDGWQSAVDATWALPLRGELERRMPLTASAHMTGASETQGADAFETVAQAKAHVTEEEPSAPQLERVFTTMEADASDLEEEAQSTASEAVAGAQDWITRFVTGSV